MTEITITSVQEAITEINKLNYSFYGYNLWFRAESSKFEPTKLMPNLFRLYKRSPQPGYKFYDIEYDINNAFQNEPYPQLLKHNLLDHKLGTCFLLQHYGGNTRLLDWTENALISLFFAVENDLDKCIGDSTIWVLNPFKLNFYTKQYVLGPNEQDPFLYTAIPEPETLKKYFNTDRLKNKFPEVRYPVALKPFYIDERMKSQSSRFTLFGHEMSGISDHPNRDEFLSKLIIPWKHFRQIKRDLFSLGISYDSVYPGLEGIAKKTNYAAYESIT